jgi:CcmD family protein
MDSLAYLGSAFGVIWIVLFAYILNLNSRQSRLERELKQLKDEKRQTVK